MNAILEMQSLDDEPVLDENRRQAFAAQMLSILNHGATAFMVSIGHRIGLFDTLARMRSGTSQSIATQAGLNERYVREWLSAMTVARIVEYDAAKHVFTLPPEHANFLARGSDVNFGIHAQFLPLIGRLELDLLECFRNGGGLPYEAYHGFHGLMAEASQQSVVKRLLEQVLPLAPGIAAALRNGIDVLDVGCGEGRAITRLARSFPNSRFTGIDMCADAIEKAQRVAAEQSLDNLGFTVRDASRLRERHAYDLITAFDAIHDQRDPAAVLANIHVALKPGGTFLMQDIAGSSRLENNMQHPAAQFLYTISCAHCMSVSLSQGGAGLGTLWGQETALEMLHTTGFKDVEVTSVPQDLMNVYYVCWKSVMSD